MSAWWKTAAPAATWLRSYQRAWFRFDLIAGLTLAAYLLPAALGDASLANLPPERGLYACLFGGLVFWIFCGSRYTSVSVTSAISLVIGSSPCGNNRGQKKTLCAPPGRAGIVGLAHCFHCVARESRSLGAFHFRECYDRLQMRRGVVSSQHTIAETFRFP